MTPNQMRAKAKKLEAEGGNQDQINQLLDDANTAEQKAYEKSGGGYGKKAGGVMNYAKGGMPDLTGDGKVTRADVLKGRGVFKKGGSVPKGMHRMPDGTMMKDSEHKKPKKPKKMTAEKVAAKAVKDHEKRMHKGMSGGGSVKGYGMARGGRACKIS